MLDRILFHHVLEPQHPLVSDALEYGLFSIDDIRNPYKGDSGHHATISAHWYLVTDWLAERLIRNGAPVLRNEYGNWWGYTGQVPMTPAKAAQFLK